MSHQQFPLALIMCNLYQMPPKGAAERAIAEAGFLLAGEDWAPVTVGPFGAGAFLVPGAAGELRSVVGQWGMIRPGQPERRMDRLFGTFAQAVEDSNAPDLDH